MTTLRAKSEDPTHHGKSCRGNDSSPTRRFTYTIDVSEDWLRNCTERNWIEVEATQAFAAWVQAQRDTL